MYCQKCRTPLKLDGSLEALNPAAFDLLVGSTGKSLPEHPDHAPSHRQAYPPERRELYDRASRHANAPIYRRSIPPPREAGAHTTPPKLSRGESSGGMSFVMLTESQLAPPQLSTGLNGDAFLGQGKGATKTNAGQETKNQSLSDEVEKTARLFDIISARSDIDHPICTECTELLVEGLHKRLAGATKERDAYISFLKTINASIPTESEVKAAEKNLKSTLQEEEAAYQELLALEKEKADLDREIADLEEESRQLDLDEEKFWRERNAFALSLAEFQDERDALNMRYDHDSRQLERLQRTNVYNDAFCIGHDGYFGTINGLRLGRLANPSVDWAEINAAWGQTCLLLATIAEKLGFQFRGYRLKPMGSTSRIEKFEDSSQNSSQPSSQPTTGADSSPAAIKTTTLDLFSSGDMPLNLPWVHRRFDAGMVAFLECLRQLGVYVENTPVPMASRRGQQGIQTTGLRLPYEIKRDKIGDASIKLGFNQNDETWTRACKYTLTCCKFLLAHASNVASIAASNSPASAGAVSPSPSPRDTRGQTSK
ncbi:autophagy protein Apg6, putative [Talaromyces stipitatus ATCC 10500]|uniref:Autophagy protein Apg6, putative n=1 Tax=Talaromyces stipitatus (strain ATCC 10500 / CBS 375.48 / QM 6759 / NRRL 1006) TaxID=441959 RepID=B8MF99_TALSN|nr:autophagy protein Apg6, putative [Talaromyces stipitatus ATCC 10500]EED16198.1 autophagy protein Apg6, putative [Talaromyces stipitatus ATCC 10500]